MSKRRSCYATKPLERKQKDLSRAVVLIHRIVGKNVKAEDYREDLIELTKLSKCYPEVSSAYTKLTEYLKGER